MVMKKYFSSIKKHKYIFPLVVLVLCIVVGVYYNDYRVENLFSHGSKTVAYVYDTGIAGRTSIRKADYYYYISQVKYEGRCSTPKYCYPKTKFYIVYYMPDEPNNSILDFNQEIRPDCVYKYFPQGENPFVSEIKQYGIER